MVAADASRVDLLVANAGVAIWEDSWETDPDEWWRVLEVNVRGVVPHLPRWRCPGCSSAAAAGS